MPIEKSLGRLPSSEAPGKPYGLLVWIMEPPQ